MAKCFKWVIGLALCFVVTATFADSTTANVTGTNTNQSQSSSANDGVQMSNTWNTPSNTDVHEHISGVTGSNTSLGLGSYSSSFSPDYCGGSAQFGVSVPYVTAAKGKPVLGEPGVPCVTTRASVHVMEFASTYGVAAIKALDLAANADSVNNKALAMQYRESSIQYSKMANTLATAAVNMQCSISPIVHQSMIDAGYPCPPTDAERSAKSQAEADKVKQEAVARGESTDPLVRSRMGLPPLTTN